jgi:membrane protein DedA with SNARE-associated domain
VQEVIEQFLSWMQANPPGPWVYPVLAGIAFVETLFPPFPGDVLFIVACGWAGTHLQGLPGISAPSFLLSPALHWTASAVSGFLGCFCATAILLLAGRGMAGSRAGGRLASWIGRERLERAERLFRKRGEIVLLGSRFVPGIRSVLVLVAGSSQMGFARAFAWAGGSAVLWYSILAVLGDITGRNLGIAREFVRHYEGVVLAALAAVFTVVLLARAVRRRKRI